jgi:aminodeoxyfutalosine deaminase
MTSVVRAKTTLLPEGLFPDVVVETSAGRVTAVREATASDPPAEPGLLVPGLVNAHLHLELAFAAGKVPGGAGLPAWVGQMVGLTRPESPEHDATPLVDAGTALVCDVSNGGDTAAALDAAGIFGVVQHERLGFSLATLPTRVRQAALPDRRHGRVVVRPSPHAVYSTPPELIRAAARPSGVPATIHLGEDPAERRFTLFGDGPFAELLDRIGVDWRWWIPPGQPPVAYLDGLKLLHPRLLVVHGVDLDERDRALLAHARAPLCLCPRSNLHVGGRLPDVPALLAAGVRLALGTDSLASAPDLDVLGELPILARAFPRVPLERWLRLATSDGADALSFGDFGRIAVGASPGLVLLAVDDPRELLEAAPPRTWKVRP